MTENEEFEFRARAEAEQSAPTRPAPADPLKAQMAAQSAESPVTAFNTGIANASTRVAAGIGSVLPQALAKYLPNQRDVDLLEAGSEGNPYARTGQIATDIAATIPLGAGKLLPSAARMAGYGAASADEGDRTTGAMLGAGGQAAGHVLSKTLGAVRAGAKPTESALGFQSHAQPPAFSPKLTAGQLAPEKGWLRKMEEGIANTPLIGAPLRKRHDETLGLYQEASRMYANPNFGPIDTIADIKKAFNNGYRSALAGETVGDVSAIGMHEMEKNMRREAGTFIKSLDPEQQKLGIALKAKADEFGQQWRSALSPEAQAAMQQLDGAYANFIPIKEASKRQNATLVKPENYTPAMVLKRTRDIPNNTQAILARQAEQSIGSIPARTTTAGTIGLGGLGLASLMGAHVPAAIGAGAAAAYGTKPGQLAARFAQKHLTADELAATLDALRRTAPAAVIGGGRDGNE